MVLIQKDKIELLGKTGMMIGLSADSRYDFDEYDFNFGDRLFIFTDGIFEQFNAALEEFGEEKVQSFLYKNRKQSTEETLEGIVKELDRFLGAVKRQDDITILGIEYK
jgi:serine phosphatase RsbU (regulator of sigma subunit)